MELEMELEEYLTNRQIVLLKLLRWSSKYTIEGIDIIFTKRDVVDEVLSEKEWKYCNSMVSGNCMWFGGNTVRKNSKERMKVHKEKVGVENKLKLMEHANPTHRKYRLFRENIKRYLIKVLAKKHSAGLLITLYDKIEKEYRIDIRGGK